MWKISSDGEKSQDGDESFLAAKSQRRWWRRQNLPLAAPFGIFDWSSPTSADPWRDNHCKDRCVRWSLILCLRSLVGNCHSLTHSLPHVRLEWRQLSTSLLSGLFDANTYVGVDDWCCCSCWCCWSISCWSSFNTELLDPQCPQHVYTLNITAWNRSISIFAFSRSAAAWRDVWSGEILAKEGKQFPQGGSRGKVSRRFSVLCLRESLSRLL